MCGRGLKKNGGQPAQGLGRSKGGFSSKIHVAVDALGNPLRVLVTPGQAHDVTQGPALIEGYQSQYVIADKAYDAQAFIDTIAARGATAVIPPKANRRCPRDYDRAMYRERHLVECLINKLKHYRRVFSRFEKTDHSFLGFLRFVATLIWLR